MRKPTRRGAGAAPPQKNHDEKGAVLCKWHKTGAKLDVAGVLALAVGSVRGGVLGKDAQWC